MRSIIYTFNKNQNSQPGVGSYSLLEQSTRSRGFTRDSITRMFTKLIPKEEYAKNERKGLIQYLYTQSNSLVDNKLEVKNEL